MNSPAVIQLVDSLALGGLEAVAVNLANALAEQGVPSHLCATRAEGPLVQRLSSRVAYLNLGRKGVADLAALRRLAQFIRQRQINLVHAHGTSLFFGALVSFFIRNVAVVWHDHFGRYATEQRPAWLYRLAARRCAAIITVNEPLADWARSKLRFRADRVWYVPNFACETTTTAGTRAELPGTPGQRVICVANLRPEKDHLTLIEAMKQVVAAQPTASLLLVGSEATRHQVARVRERIGQLGLDHHVFFLGSRPDVGSILQGANIGVLSSSSEGMPLALLEYGLAGLPVVATSIGQVPDVLDQGRAGILVAPGRPAALAAALVRLLESPPLREQYGAALQRRVRQHYSPEAVLRRIQGIYETVLESGAGRAVAGD